LFESFAYHGYDLAQVLAGGELGDYAAVLPVDANLRGDHTRENALAAGHDGSGGLVARGFDAENARVLSSQAITSSCQGEMLC
jgi:hypothetical protein